MENKIKILFLAANPTSTTQLRLDEEIREIHSKIRAAEFRDHFELASRWAVRPGDLLQACNEVRPHIVHFSGHGDSTSELILEDKDGNPKRVSEESIVALFRSVKDNIRLVVLNACHSHTQAKAITDEIDCAIGMNKPIGDAAAIEFGSRFYGALAFGLSIRDAFQQGLTSLMLNSIPEEDTPVLFTRPGVDAQLVSFINRTPKNPILTPLVTEILLAAVEGNAPVEFSSDDAGVAVLVGAKPFDSNGDLEQAANLDDAITTLVKMGLLKEAETNLYRVTRAGYEEACRHQEQIDPRFREVKKQMPKLLAEMREDLQNEPHVREFLVLKKTNVLGGSEKPRFRYDEENHENLRGKVDILENYGFVIDVTPKNTKIYRMTEEFVKLLLRG